MFLYFSTAPEGLEIKLKSRRRDGQERVASWKCWQVRERGKDFTHCKYENKLIWTTKLTQSCCVLVFFKISTVYCHLKQSKKYPKVSKFLSSDRENFPHWTGFKGGIG